MAGLNKDIHLTAQFLVFLRAGFYGQIMFDTALKRLQSNFLAENYTDLAHKAFDKIDPWMKDVQQGLPIFATAWTAPETFDAISAFGFMKELKRDLALLVPQVEQALQIQNLPSEREAVKLLAASILRSASVRNAYVDSAVQTYTALRTPNLVEQISPELPGAQEYLRVGQVIVDTFSSPAAYSDDLCEQLRMEASLTPGDFRSHIHDANILLSVFHKEFTWEMAEFTKAEAQDWSDRGVPAVMAGYWKAYEFTPDECVEWQQVGIIAGPLAANWKRAGFDPASTVEWLKEGFTPALALRWNKAGFTPPRASALLKRGITSPSDAPQAGGGGDYEAEDDQEQDLAV